AINFLWNEAEKKNKDSETLVPLVKDLIEIAKKIKDPTKRFEIIKRISERTGFPEIVLLEEIKEKKSKKSQIVEVQDNILEREFLIYIIKDRDFFDLIKDEINENYLITKKYRENRKIFYIFFYIFCKKLPFFYKKIIKKYE
ncbi:MAG: hypothetical protein ACK4WJ_06485, partial [Endomicrobiia bacterium]